MHMCMCITSSKLYFLNMQFIFIFPQLIYHQEIIEEISIVTCSNRINVYIMVNLFCNTF